MSPRSCNFMHLLKCNMAYIYDKFFPVHAYVDCCCLFNPNHTLPSAHTPRQTHRNKHTHSCRSSCSPLFFLQLASADVLSIFTLTILSSFTLKSSFTPNATSQVQKVEAVEKTCTKIT